MSTFVVLGGGISGLSSAYYLSRASLGPVKKVILLEGSPRLGGWIATHKYDDGAMFEKGPRTLRPIGLPGQNTMELIDELGLSDKLLTVERKSPVARNRYLYIDGKLNILPNNYSSMFKTLPPFSKPVALYGLKEPFQPKTDAEDETIYNFMSRRFSAEVAKYAVDALTRGVFGGDSKQLSVKSCFPPLWNYEQNNGSIIKGMLFGEKVKKPESKSKLVHDYKREKWASISLRGGLEDIPLAMSRSLQERGVDVHLNSPCTGVEFSGAKAKVRWKDNEVEADHVISSLPAQNLAQVLHSEHSLMRAELNKISSVHMAVVGLEYEGNVMPIQGFGHLIPSCEPERMMGVIYESCVFPEFDRPNTTRLVCMMGGAWFDELFGENQDEQHFEDVAIEGISKQLGIKTKPYRVMTTLQKNCIPQYHLGHSVILENLEGYIQDNNLALSLVGSSYKGASVNDCIYNSRLETEAVLNKLK